MIKKITIGFSRAKSKAAIFSTLIRKFEGTDYSHTYLRFHEENSDEDLIYQASGLIVNLEGVEHFETHAEIVREFDIYISEAQYRQLWRMIIQQLGKKYSMRQIFFILIKKLFPRSSWKGNGDAEFICSEIVALILMRFKGVKFEKPIDQITPKDIYTFLSTQKYL